MKMKANFDLPEKTEGFDEVRCGVVWCVHACMCMYVFVRVCA